MAFIIAEAVLQLFSGGRQRLHAGIHRRRHQFLLRGGDLQIVLQAGRRGRGGSGRSDGGRGEIVVGSTDVRRTRGGRSFGQRQLVPDSGGHAHAAAARTAAADAQVAAVSATGAAAATM